MKKNNLRIWIWTIVGVLIILAVIFLVFLNRQTVEPVTINQTSTGNQAVIEPESVQDINSQDIGAGSVSISYKNALIKYADRRIQLNPTCQATPTNVTYKDNIGIMIDNRSPQTRTVKVGTTFTIKPWGFKIVVLPDVYLKSKTLMVNCDKLKNIATILVQE